ncbi:unnamed protein product [Mytilus coruscus]|uniref:Fibronectin type-III domain-containing protein n=1 Tax=Mytilus coruscus TaxID=42192 RepID=A0A6J8EF74_MYTCO|nr:unnamed protein product [Mytilus coruscus]
MICCHYLIVIWVLSLILEVDLFELRCPENLQRHLRVKSFCNASSHDSYACLFDEHTDVFKESCTAQPSFVNDPSTTQDNNCRCDHIDSYAFLIQPRNKCYCIPSEEDCTCFRKKCPENSSLSSDYNCTSVLPPVNDSICKEYTYSRNTNTTDKISVETIGKEKKDRHIYNTVSYASFPCAATITVTSIVCCIVCAVVYRLKIGKCFECLKETEELSRSLSVMKASTVEKKLIQYNCSVSARSITVTWDTTKLKDQHKIDHFIIKYRESVDKPFDKLTVRKEENLSVIYDLRSNTMYEIELYWCDNTGKTHQFLNPNEKTNTAFAEVLTKQATKIDNVYLLKPKSLTLEGEKEHTDDTSNDLQVRYADMIDSYIPSENKSDEKTLIFVGAKGAGRSTLINALINHILEVSYSDDHRFALIDPTTEGPREINQLTEYKIPRIKGSRVNFKLNIIQTPDINDSNDGLNEEMNKYITALCVKNTNRYFAILVVMPSSSNQLTDGQRHVLSGICRDNIADKVFLILTFHVEGNTNNCLDIVAEAKIHYDHSFEFDNSNVFHECNSNDANVNVEIWNNRRQTFNKLFKKLEETG